MAECTDAERALLNAIASGNGVVEARVAVALESRNPELFEAAVEAMLERNAAAERASAAMAAYLDGLDSRNPGWDAVYEAVENEARSRRGLPPKEKKPRPIGIGGHYDAQIAAQSLRSGCIDGLRLR